MDKKKEAKSLCLYLAFTFGISWAMFFALILSGGKLFDDAGNMSGTGSLVCTLGMLCPAIGMLLTRRVTKEGYALTGKDSVMLGISLKEGKIIFFIIALLLPWIINELSCMIKILLDSGCFSKDLGEAMTGDKRYPFVYPLMAIVSGAFISIGGLGEELGWRGYMMPKLINITGKRKALLTGGIIWGIWHWPLTYMGHNFGTDYKGYPYLGFAAMCLLCVISGTVLTFLTMKSGSIWPAAIFHAIGNASPTILRFFIDESRITGAMAKPFVSFLIYLIPYAFFALICFVIFLKSNKE